MYTRLKSPSQYIQGPGVSRGLGNHLSGMGSRILILMSEGGFRRFWPAIETSCAGTSAGLLPVLFGGECSWTELLALGAEKSWIRQRARRFWQGSRWGLCRLQPPRIPLAVPSALYITKTGPSTATSFWIAARIRCLWIRSGSARPRPHCWLREWGTRWPPGLRPAPAAPPAKKIRLAGFRPKQRPLWRISAGISCKGTGKRAPGRQAGTLYARF